MNGRPARRAIVRLALVLGYVLLFAAILATIVLLKTSYYF